MLSNSILGSALLSSAALLQAVEATPIVVRAENNTLYGTAPGDTKISRQAEGTLNFSFRNWLQDTNVFAYIFGLDSNNQFAFSNPADPTNFYYPANCGMDSNTEIPSADIAYQLGGYDTTVDASIPGFIAGGRVYLSQGPLTFFCNVAASGEIGIVTPAASSPSDPNNAVNYGFMELTFNAAGLTTNPSAVDIVGLPLGIAVTDASNGMTTTVGGLISTAVTDVCNGLKEQTASDGAPWDQECIYLDGSTDPFRIISPEQLRSNQTTLFDGYFDQLITDVYSTYAGTPLRVSAGAEAGYVDCTVTDDVLNCPDQGHPYTRPTPEDIFGCPAATGAFAVVGGSDAVIAPTLCAAFNRGTLLLPEDPAYSAGGLTCAGSVQPCLPPASYYPAGGVYNHYSRIVHENAQDGIGYAFAYDDNDSPNSSGGPFGGVVSGVVFTPTPGVLEVRVGGYDLAP